MQCERKQADDFLRKYGMICETEAIPYEIERFIQAMKDGLAGRQSSLKMIPTHISVPRAAVRNKPVIVLDAGGTSLRSALVVFGDDGPVISHFQQHRMPGVDSAVTAEEFFREVVTLLRPLLNQSDTIAFCFSYASLPCDNHDAIVEALGKQIRIDGIIGRRLGAGLAACLKKESRSGEKRVIVVNDSTAALLGGAAVYGDGYDSYIGFILGTGTNTCYAEKKMNIPGVGKTSPQDTMLINVESGEYMGFHPGRIDEAFFDSLSDGNISMFEKMAAGGYLGGLTQEVIRWADRDGLFSKGSRFGALSRLTGREADRFLADPYGSNRLSACCGEGGHDRQILYYLIDGIYRRAASLIAVNLAAVLLKSGKGSDPTRPACVVAEGSTFYNSQDLRHNIEKQVGSILEDALDLHCRFVKVEYATIIGIAFLGLAEQNPAG